MPILNGLCIGDELDLQKQRPFSMIRLVYPEGLTLNCQRYHDLYYIILFHGTIDKMQECFGLYILDMI